MNLPAWPGWLRRRVAWYALATVFAAGTLTVGVEALVRARLDPALGQGGARFYARPPLLQLDARVDRSALQAYLGRLAYRRVENRVVGPGQYRVDGDEVTIARRQLPAPAADAGGPVTIHFGADDRVRFLEDSAGQPLTAATLEPEPLKTPGDAGDDGVLVPLGEIPQHLVDAVLTIEDRRFFNHWGVDWGRVAGAALANVRARGIEQGGSTITQQLAKNLFLSSRRTPVRKIRELAMALALEARYTKSRILETYLNQVYLGQDRGYAVRGVARGAQVYFGKPLSELTVGESAMLAGLIHGPNLYDPFDHPATAVARRNLVLGLMRDRGLIDSSSARRAASAKLGVHRGQAPNRAGRYFVDFALRELGDLPTTGPVFTTLDMDRQIAAEKAVNDGLAQLERERPSLRRSESPLQAVLVALDPASGEILSMVGGRDYGSTQFNRAADARRQPGSAFKPIVALAALSRRSVTLASTLDDAPLEVETNAGLWHPANYDGQFRGPVTLRRALEQSLNVPFARLGLTLTHGEIALAAQQLGIASPLREVPSLALGSSEVTPLELTGAYAVLAAQGVRFPLHAIRQAVGVDAPAMQGGLQVYQPAETFLVTSALEGAVERGTGRGLRSWGYDGPIAAKSGTSNDYRDAWFVGYTPGIVVGVWVGYDDGRSLGLSGAQAALPIFARFLNATRQSSDDAGFVTPSELEVKRVNPETGFVMNEFCGGELEYFLPGTAPSAAEACDLAVPQWVAEAGSRVVGGIRSFLDRLFGRKRHRP